MKKNILIFNVNWLGDVLFSTAAIRNIRYNYPESFIACVIPGRCLPVLSGNPHIDEIILFDEKKEQNSLLSRLKFVQFLKQRRFDIAFLLHRSFTRALISRLADIPLKFGYYSRKRGFLLSRKIIAPEINKLHRIDYYLNLISAAGLTVKDRFTEFFVSPQEEKEAEKFLALNEVTSSDFIVGINAGGNWIPKRWPKEYWAELADLAASKLGAKLIITGNSGDAQLAAQVRGMMKQKLISACGVLDIKQFAALSKKMDVFLSADTGPLHIANAAGANNIVSLFGPTDPLVTGPYPPGRAIVLHKDVKCKIPCYAKDCRDNVCMKSIKPEEVFRILEKIKVS